MNGCNRDTITDYWFVADAICDSRAGEQIAQTSLNGDEGRQGMDPTNCDEASVDRRPRAELEDDGR